MKKQGEPIYYRDGTSPEILHKLGIHRAKVLVIAISDPLATRKIVQIAKTLNSKIHIIVRTRFITEIEELKKLGADEVIPEEFETSLEIFARVLHYFGTPRNKILQMIEKIRAEGYEILTMPQTPKTRAGIECVIFEGLEMDSFLVEKDSWLIGHSLKSLDLRHRAKVTVIAVQRGQETILNPSADFILKEGDIIIYVGNKKQLVDALNSEKRLIFEQKTEREGFEPSVELLDPTRDFQSRPFGHSGTSPDFLFYHTLFHFI